ncbi:Rust resistance kinase Lr10 [Camellia lanceoleosa]|uniref:Rust resistance kinase Lr10 n=1 Tax=Camellia lanceoleosa TaxID=1840588 RepID=A0ACC0J1B3_9ERIC|nr:Rust resistance kinase Lr10 [Camellia lanceoleosa]
MATLLILLLFLNLPAGLRAGAAATGREDCKPTRCNSDGPKIRYPFRLKDNEQQQQPKHCGYPGFDLSCDHENHTMLELPFSVKVAVKEIDYISQSIHTYDPHDCFPHLLQNLSLSPTTSPFQLATDYNYNYSFFSCSSTEPISYNPITCLSIDPNHKVYAFPSDYFMSDCPLLSCKKMSFKISSPIPYDIFYQQPYQLTLNWSKPTCGICEKQSKYCRLKDNSSDHETECVDDTPKSPITGILRWMFLLVVVIIAMYCVLRLIVTKREGQAKIERFLDDYKALKPARYSYADIKNVTNKFKDKIGQGGYGTVYKGKLSNDVHVAVKILDNVKGNGDEFINEVGTIGTIHHINVVRLVGYCADGFKRVLVYEFLPNHSLEKFISSKHEKNSLGWEKLHDIALGIAKGIDYLHQGCNQRILHFDIKPHNILLDHNFNPKISDFGLAKLCSKEQSVVSMTAARG